jgi:hypothetical protein
LPASLKRAIEEVAREDGTTLNQFIVSAVAEKLAVLKTADYFAKRAARADFRAFDRLMRRRGGEAPQPGDEMPENYHKKKSPRRLAHPRCTIAEGQWWGRFPTES